MRFQDGRFRASGLAEQTKLALTFASAGAQVGLNIALSVLIGSGFRSHAPWALFLAISLAAAWAACLLLLLTSLWRLVRYLNANQAVLKDARSALVLPLGAESLAATLGSAFLSAAVVWITKTARDSPSDLSSTERYGQFDVYFPISIGFQILALPGCVRLGDIFGYAKSKAIREVESAPFRADKAKRKTADLSSVSTHGSLISAESIRAAQKELDLAKARLDRQDRLASTSTGASAQSVGPQRSPMGRSLVPMVERPEEQEVFGVGNPPPPPEVDPAKPEMNPDNASFWRRRDPSRERRSSRKSSLRSGDSVDAEDTRITIFGEQPSGKRGVGRLFP